MLGEIAVKHAPWLLSVLALGIIMFTDVQGLKNTAKTEVQKSVNKHNAQDIQITKNHDDIIKIKKDLECMKK